VPTFVLTETLLSSAILKSVSSLKITGITALQHICFAKSRSDCYISNVTLFFKQRATGSLPEEEAFEIWIYRRMKNISWVDKISNEELLA